MPRKAPKAMSAPIIGYDGATVGLTDVILRKGIAGQMSVTAMVTHTFPDADPQHSQWTLIGDTYGSPIVVKSSTSPMGETFIRNAERFGDFGADPREYLRRFVLGEEV